MQFKLSLSALSPQSFRECVINLRRHEETES